MKASAAMCAWSCWLVMDGSLIKTLLLRSGARPSECRQWTPPVSVIYLAPTQTAPL